MSYGWSGHSLKTSEWVSVWQGISSKDRNGCYTLSIALFENVLEGMLERHSITPQVCASCKMSADTCICRSVLNWAQWLEIVLDMFTLHALLKRPSELSAPPCTDESSSKSCKAQVAPYVYMAEARASIPVNVCRILSTLTATGFANAGFRASCCALALLDRASTYVLLNERAPSCCFSLLPWVLLWQCWEHKCQHVNPEEKKKNHGTTRAHMLTEI